MTTNCPTCNSRFSPPSERAETDVRLDEVVLRTLAREPDRRYQQASQVKTDVEALRGPIGAANPAAVSARRWIGKGVAGFIAGILATFVLAVLLVLLAAWHFEPIIQANIAEAKAAGKAQAEAMASLKAAMNESSRQHAANVQSQNDPAGAYGMTAPGGEGVSGMMEMGMGGMGMSMSPNPFDSGSAIVFDNSVPVLNAGSFNLTDEQRAAVNAILKETHERYLKEEALHSIVSVDANGVQTTEISAFPDQRRTIENEMWTKLDDAVPVETQKEFRELFNLYTTEGESYGSDSAAADTGAMGMGSSAMSGGGMGMPIGMLEPKKEIHQGLLGWETSEQPRIVEISRTGRWYQWSIATNKEEQHYLIGRQRTPTLPSALQRFYREPGQWMAVANARVAYEMKNWMQVSDYFTAESITREWVIALADVERLNENLEVTTTDVQKRLSERLEAEAIRTTETKEMVRIGSGEEAESSDFNNTHLRPLMSELAGVSATDVDEPIARVTKAIPLQTLKQHFGWTVLALWLVTEHGLDVPSDFAALHGEVSSYTETGDTASATLTIPNKPPVPIRFKRENGQWKIDAIGSNERLLERLKQTKIWKQHAEIEAVLENARTVSVLVTLTEEAQSEWLGEMTVAMLKGGGLTNLQSRLPETFFDQEIHAAMQAVYQKNLNLLSPEAQSKAFAGQSFEAMFATASVSAKVRRQAVIDLAKLCGDRNQLLQKLLEFRDKAGIRTKFNGSLSRLREVSATSKEGLFTFGWDNPDTRTELPTPVKVVILQIDGLWKLNTIIDPALKPWPLPTEEPAPPAEANPVDGATNGVDLRNSKG